METPELNICTSVVLFLYKYVCTVSYWEEAIILIIAKSPNKPAKQINAVFIIPGKMDGITIFIYAKNSFAPKIAAASKSFLVFTANRLFRIP